MNTQLLWSLYGWLMTQAHPVSGHHYQYSDAWIVLPYLWAVASDRPVCWACQGTNWPPGFLADRPPSPATMSRRLRTKSVRKLLLKLLLWLQPPAAPDEIWYVDGKPLTVGGSSGDPDAKVGRGAGLLAKGYKLHLLYSSAGRIGPLKVTALNVDEPKAAQQMLHGWAARGYLVGDHLFDTNDTYDAAAWAGLQLLTNPDRKASNPSQHHRQSPHRIAGLALAQSPAGRRMRRQRSAIDRFFGSLGNYGGGLQPLPNFVRRLGRVRLWVVGKLILFQWRKTQNKGVAA